MTNIIEIHELIDKRWSPRAFSSRMVEKEKIQKLFQAASLAPSCYNEQPWRFVYGTSDYPERYNQLLSCLVEFNQLWVKGAPMIILCLASRIFSRNNMQNYHSRHDLGLAVGNMALQATHMGLHMHQMAGFSEEKVRELFGVPNNFDIVSMIAVGYMGDASQLPEDLAKMENPIKERRPLEDIIFDGDWDKMK